MYWQRSTLVLSLLFIVIKTPGRIGAPFIKVNSSSSCPYAESQPGQLLAVIECSDPDEPTGASVNASIMSVFKEEGLDPRTILVPSTEADIVLQRDHNSPSHFYLLLEHVNFVQPESNQEVAPTYKAYVQCTNGVSNETQPVTFCIKHNRLIINLTVDSFRYKPATLYFTNIPREFHVFPNSRQPLFSVRVGVFNAPTTRSSANSTCVASRLMCRRAYRLRLRDIECQIYSVSGDHPFVVVNGTRPKLNNQNLSDNPVIRGTSPKLEFNLLLSRNRSNLLFPGSYNLVISLVSRKFADKAVMVTTIFVYDESDERQNASDSRVPLYFQNVLLGDFMTNEQVIHAAAPAGTLLGVFKCSGGVTEPSITVTRTHTLTSDVSGGNSISFDIVQDHNRSDIHYLLVDSILTTAHQYYLVSCSDGQSVFSERIAFRTVTALQNNIQPYFRSLEPQYNVNVGLDGEDKEVFEVEAVLAGVPLENVTYEVETQLFCDLPFYINNNQVMLNVSEVQETGRDTLYDVVISATAAQDTALFRMTNLSTGRVHTVVRVDGSVIEAREDQLTIALAVTIPLLCLGNVVLVIAICICLIKRRMKNKKYNKFYWMTKSSRSSIKLQVDTEWVTEWRYVKMGELLGKGQFGKVYRGMITWQGVPAARQKQFDRDSLIPVAIKMIKGDHSGDIEKAFSEELALMVKVSTGQNPHIVKLIGCITNQSPVAVLLELAPYGDLCSYLRTQRKAGVSFKTDSETPTVDLYENLSPLDSSDLTSFTQQIASGMEYLAALSVIHRDLACRNVLVGEGKVLKIADFGLSRDTDLYVSTLSTKLPIRWMAPESIQDRQFSEKSDVWSYGVTVWEICSFGGVPYADLSNKVVVERVLAGYRLDRPENCSDEIYGIMENCWKQDPKARPTFSEIHQTLCTLIEAKNSDSYISMLGMDQCPTECIQAEEESNDQLQTAENAESLVKNNVFMEHESDVRVVVEMH